MATRSTKAAAAEKPPSWEWNLDEFDSKEEVEEAILKGIFDSVLCDEDEEVTGPDGQVYDVVVNVTVVARVP